MNPRRWSPDVVAPPAGRYSHLAVVPPGCETLYVAGQLGVLPNGDLVGSNAETQGRQIFANIEALLSAAGGEPQHLVKLLTLVSGTEQLAGYRTAQAAVFGRWFPDGDHPAQSLAVVAGLASPEYVVEVEAVAAIPQA